MGPLICYDANKFSSVCLTSRLWNVSQDEIEELALYLNLKMV